MSVIYCYYNDECLYLKKEKKILKTLVSMVIIIVENKMY